MSANELPPAVDPGQETPPTRATNERKAPVPILTRRGAPLKLYRAIEAWYRHPDNKEAYERSIA